MEKKNTLYTEYGQGDEWEVNGKTFYTAQFSNSGYLDFYEDKEAWERELVEGYSNEKRIDSIPNPFLDDEEEQTFYIICAIFAACGDLKQTFDAFVSVFEFKEHTTLKPCKLG